MNPLLQDRFNTTIDECESTNDLARTFANADCPHGTWISSRRQTQGRGRSGNVWAQSEGNLFFSIVLRGVSPAHLTWVPLLIAIASIEALIETPLSPESAGAIRIKWPNDLYVNNRKLGGILCESFFSPPVIVAGIGINIATVPDAFTETSASLFSEKSDPSKAFLEALRPRLAKKIIDWVALLEHTGPKSIINKYEQIAYFHKGESIQWSNDQQGRVIGLGTLGELLVQTEAGEKSLFSEVISRVRKSQ